jgi:hypothetical protein
MTMRVPPRVEKWLIGPKSDPSLRARYWLDVEGRAATDARVRAAVKQIGKVGWAADLLSLQLPDGQWATPGTSATELYRPKFVATNWFAIVLAELGMTRNDPRIARTAQLLIDRWSRKRLDLSGRAGEICVTGNAVRTLVKFGYLDDPSVQRSIAWILKTQKSDGGWHCFPARSGTLDGWEGLAALAEIPVDQRDTAIQRSIARGAEFFLDRHLSEEGKVRYAPWFRIHYPNHYYYDLFVGLRMLTRLGFGADPRLAPALRWLGKKRGRDGTWSLDAVHPDIDPVLAGYQYDHIMFPMELEPVGTPSRWATTEALAVLARVDRC